MTILTYVCKTKEGKEVEVKTFDEAEKIRAEVLTSGNIPRQSTLKKREKISKRTLRKAEGNFLLFYPLTSFLKYDKLAGRAQPPRPAFFQVLKFYKFLP